jgi:hypothetical protein
MPHEMNSGFIGAWHCQPVIYDYMSDNDVADDWAMFCNGGEL